jgi:hypothetical protein
MIAVQPAFNRESIQSLGHKSNNHVLFQYLQLVETRRATRYLLTQLDEYYHLQTPDGLPRAITQCFLLVLRRTASELFYLLSQFQPRRSKRKKFSATSRVQSRMYEDHYLSTGMKRMHMLDNLKRVLKHWHLDVEKPRAMEWGSVQFRSGQCQVFTSPNASSMQDSPDCTS